MENWWDLDFDHTLREFDFTRRAVQGMNRVLDSEKFRKMDARAIYEYLFREMELVSFKDYLKRYIYERAEIEEPYFQVPDEVYREIIMDSFRENCAPHSLTPTTRKWSAIVKSWLTQESVRRSAVFLLGFGLRMTEEDVSMFLTKVLKEQDFDFTDASETIYWYCYKNQMGYPKAEALLEAYGKMEGPDGPEEAGEVKTDPSFLETEEDLLTYLAALKKSAAYEKCQDAAFREFEELYGHVREIIARIYQQDETMGGKGRGWRTEDISAGEVEKMLCSGIPVNQSGNLKKMSASLLAKHFCQRRMSRQRIDGVLKRQLAVERFDLITLLFFIYAQEVEPDWPTERYLRYIEEINGILGRCGMAPIYPANPYEIFVLMCLLTDCPLAVYSEIWELSYQEQE